MPRGAFNTSCDLYFGPGTATPGALKQAAVPCRLVLDSKIVTLRKFLSKQTHWLTMDAIQPDGAAITHVAPGYFIDCTFADRVAIPSGGAIGWGVLWVDAITPDIGTPYWRAHIFALPDPDGEY